ncbi:MAG: ATP-binding cassette domain-containing protein [Gammaproteobacteria bacterium]|nr:ATP-binding cassette domain-containing protein [Gammaproteobacteria bacterium]
MRDGHGIGLRYRPCAACGATRSGDGIGDGVGHAMNRPLLLLEGVSRTFAGDGVSTQALADVDLAIHAGEFVCIIGASGSGKTTLLNILGCLGRPTTGTYRIAGVDVTTLSSDDLARLRRETFGFVFQNYSLLESATACGNVELPGAYARIAGKRRRRRARGILESIGLGDRADHRPSELSGGEQQRVAIARALMNDAQVILADEPTGALDTAQSEEILALLEQLAERGHAVILVTHDPRVAARAQRRIELADGRIVADDAGEPLADANTAAKTVRRGGVPWLAAIHGGWVAMRRRPLAAALTVASVALGIWSALALLGLSEGVGRDSLESLERMGANRLTVGALAWVGGKSEWLPLTMADAEAMREVVNVNRVLPRMNKRLPVIRGDETIDEVIVRATTNSEPKTTQNVSWPLQGGSYLSPRDRADVAQVAVIGPTVYKRLFTPGEDPVGEHILVDGLPFLVKGVLLPHPRREGEGEAFFSSDTAYEWIGTVLHVPFETGAQMLFGTDQLNMIDVMVADVSRIDETSAAIRDLMFRRHGREEYSVTNQATNVVAFKEVSSIHAALFGTIAGVALLVGGFGVMAVTLAAVSHRTREIGLRMAVGARRRDIMAQFLVETAVATTLGGAVGTLLSILGSPLLAQVADAPVAFPPWVVPVALGCAMVTGLIFGIAPARRAARLDPVAALATD